MSKFFFDFDGTLVNSQGRLYKLFCELCPENTFSCNAYWDIKRGHVTQKDFLTKYFHFDDAKTEKFRQEWFAKVEEEGCVLNDDFPVEGVGSVLQNLAQTHAVYLLTNRQSPELVKKQLQKFGWLSFFKKIFVTKQKISKQALVSADVSDIGADDYFIGDTGEDIKCAKAFGAKSVAVTWGVMNRTVLEGYVPDLIIDFPSQLSVLMEMVHE